jgi:enoyl-CoA hydratase/carnithine racemase
VPYETIRCEKDDGVAVLTLHRPARHNAIDATMARELPDAWRALKADDDVLVVIVTGAGERAFCTGFDVGAIASGNAAVADGDGTRAPLGFTAIHNGCFKPVITAVNGIVCGGGLHFVADSDLVVAAEHATFFDSHVDVGMVAGLEPIGLARRMPLGAVLRMACVGRAERMTATRAFELGLVGDVVPGASLLAHARQLADRIKQCSPAAVQATKRAIWESLDLGLADALELGWRAVEGHRGHPDVAEGARAFRERRAPRWQCGHIGPETRS